jgi:hypothetical protein
MRPGLQPGRLGHHDRTARCDVCIEYDRALLVGDPDDRRTAFRDHRHLVGTGCYLVPVQQARVLWLGAALDDDFERSDRRIGRRFADAADRGDGCDDQ